MVAGSQSASISTRNAPAALARREHATSSAACAQSSRAGPSAASPCCRATCRSCRTITHLSSATSTTSTCTVTVGPNKVIVPVGVTITWDAPDENNVINAYNTGAFAVECINCIVAGTIA